MIGVTERKKSSQAPCTLDPFHYLNFNLCTCRNYGKQWTGIDWPTGLGGPSVETDALTWLRSRRAIRCSFGDQTSSPVPTCRPFFRFLSCSLKKTSTPINSEKVSWHSGLNFFLERSKNPSKSLSLLRSYVLVSCLSSKQLDCSNSINSNWSMIHYPTEFTLAMIHRLVISVWLCLIHNHTVTVHTSNCMYINFYLLSVITDKNWKI